jgi:hypothetical protein
MQAPVGKPTTVIHIIIFCQRGHGRSMLILVFRVISAQLPQGLDN